MAKTLQLSLFVAAIIGITIAPAGAAGPRVTFSEQVAPILSPIGTLTP